MPCHRCQDVISSICPSAELTEGMAEAAGRAAPLASHPHSGHRPGADWEAVTGGHRKADTQECLVPQSQISVKAFFLIVASYIMY